jgi:cytochrome c peroxidase
LLFYDPILSGNRNISCATCHHPRFGTSDGVSLSLGEGGVGLGPERRADPENLPEQRIPRNATALFNLGAREFTVLFHDGRIETDPDRKGGLRTPLEDDMTVGFSGVLSAQTMFPVLSQDEMAGHYSENEVSQAVRRGMITGEGGAWDLIADRVAAIPAYRQRFEAVYPDIGEGRDIAFTDISNAIAAFIAWEWRSDDSPFDAHLRGEAPLVGPAAEGMALFFGEARCADCHAGPFQTDHGFHAMGVPQIGPGKAARFETHARDEGRFRVTGREEDRFAFRTPSLRNVLHTAPYGHSGAYRDLAAFLAAHGRPGEAMSGYAREQAVLPELPGAEDWRILEDPGESAAIRSAAEPGAGGLGPAEIEALIAFLGALSDPVALEGRLGVPESVPSGLPVDR